MFEKERVVKINDGFEDVLGASNEFSTAVWWNVRRWIEFLVEWKSGTARN